MNQPASEKSLNVERISEILPHRYPFLMIDRVLDYELNQWLRALKNISVNEPQFTGHFPNHPVMPGVLLLESMAQAAGVLGQLSMEKDLSKEPMFYLVKIDKARFNQVVVPGDQVIIEVEQQRRIRNMGLYQGKALVDDKVVARAEFLCAEREA